MSDGSTFAKTDDAPSPVDLFQDSSAKQAKSSVHDTKLENNTNIWKLYKYDSDKENKKLSYHYDAAMDYFAGFDRAGRCPGERSVSERQRFAERVGSHLRAGRRLRGSHLQRSEYFCTAGRRDRLAHSLRDRCPILRDGGDGLRLHGRHVSGSRHVLRAGPLYVARGQRYALLRG